VLRAHEELYPAFAGRTKYLFLDEVQDVPGWDAFVRRLHDTEDAHIYVTVRHPTCCRGKSRPASGAGACRSRCFPCRSPSSSRFAVRPSALLAVVGGENGGGLDEYLATGGLPEVVLADEDLRQRILKEYVAWCSTRISSSVTASAIRW